MKNIVFILTLISLLLSFAGKSQGFGEYYDKWRNRSILKHANVGIAVHDIESNNLLNEYNGAYMLIPASSLKLITTLSAHEILGKDYRYTTTVGYNGQIDPDGTLQGDIIIKGSGDPTLGSDRITSVLAFETFLDKCVDEIVKFGITCVDGDIIIDESEFDSYPIAPTWQWNDLGNYYAGGAWGVNVNENEYNIYFNSNRPIGSTSQLLYHSPKVPWLELENEVTVDSAHTGDNAYVFGGPYDYTKRIVGTIPLSKQNFKIKGSLPDPPSFLAYHIRNRLMQEKIPSSGTEVIIKKALRKPLAEIYTFTSPPLSEIIAYANKFSINLYCEALLKTIGNTVTKEGSGGHGIYAIKKLMTDKKIDLNGLNLQDGSGLSARSMVSPEILSEWVAIFAKEQGIETLKKYLPKAGAEGTVRSFLTGKSAQSNTWVKSGSMEGIQSYTGIFKARSGRWCSFSIIVNGYQGKYKDIKPQMEAAIDYLYKNH